MTLFAEVFDDRACELGEGPFAAGGQSELVSWVDITGQRFLTRDLISGEISEEMLDEDIGFAIPTDLGGRVFGVNSGPILKSRSGAITRLFSRGSDDAPTRWNDGKVGPDGSLFAGTMAYSMEKGTANLFHFDPINSSLTTLLEGTTISNGMDWSPITECFYFIDSRTQSVDEISLEANQVISRRPVIEIDPSLGAPDGMTIDSEGGFWIGMWGGGKVLHFDSAFVLQEEVSLPTKFITSCAFAGPTLNQLVITSAHYNVFDTPEAGMTFIASVDVAGKRPYLFPEESYSL